MKYNDKIISLMEENGYYSYSNYLKSNNKKAIVSNDLRKLIENILYGKSSNQLKKIRRIYLEDIKR